MKYNLYFISEELGWGYHIYSPEFSETFRRNYGFKTMEDAEKEARIEANKLENQIGIPDKEFTE